MLCCSFMQTVSTHPPSKCVCHHCKYIASLGLVVFMWNLHLVWCIHTLRERRTRNQKVYRSPVVFTSQKNIRNPAAGSRYKPQVLCLWWTRLSTRAGRMGEWGWTHLQMTCIAWSADSIVYLDILSALFEGRSLRKFDVYSTLVTLCWRGLMLRHNF